MARIVGVDLPKNKRGEIGLTYIYGIGRSTARKILEVAGISYDLKVQDWSDDQIGAIRSTIADMGIKVEGECRSAVQLNIKRLMDIGCYRGIRHRLGMAKKTGTVKKKVVKVGAVGNAYVHSTFNNVIITITNEVGDVISWSSAGKMGFRGSKKNTPYAAQTASADCAKVAYDMGLRKVKVYVKGPGAGRESAVRTIHGAGIEVMEIIDVTPLPHNGCRAPNRRRG